MLVCFLISDFPPRLGKPFEVSDRMNKRNRMKPQLPVNPVILSNSPPSVAPRLRGAPPLNRITDVRHAHTGWQSCLPHFPSFLTHTPRQRTVSWCVAVHHLPRCFLTRPASRYTSELAAHEWVAVRQS